MERKLNLFGHMMKDSRLVKKVMFGTMEGESRRGRPCRELLDDIKEWGGEEIYILNKKAHGRYTWSNPRRARLH